LQPSGDANVFNHIANHIFFDESRSFNPSIAAAVVIAYCCAAVAGTHTVTLNEIEHF
jgi:hypothetical protein